MLTDPANEVVALRRLDGSFYVQIGELVRPDHYLFGAASAMIELSGLVDDLRLQMTAEHLAPVASVPANCTEGRRS